jgi:hypothetical protein
MKKSELVCDKCGLPIPEGCGVLTIKTGGVPGSGLPKRVDLCGECVHLFNAFLHEGDGV